MIPENYKIYPRPLVKEVIFQIQFSNLFIIESKIGEYQTMIMEQFPESKLLYRRQLVFADVGPQSELKELPDQERQSSKIWQFESSNKYTLSVLSNSLDISSQHHKSYYSPDKNGFRDIIKFAVDNFLQIIPLNSIKRIGLRYSDEAPVPSMNNQIFKQWYNTTFPLERFNLEDIRNLHFSTTVKRDQYNLIFRESLRSEKGKMKYFLDFDGYTTNIKANEYLTVLDDLHNLVHTEWENTVKEPVKEYMSAKDDG